jgi:hypothetical protein
MCRLTCCGGPGNGGTKASGTRKVILARYACNRRLGDACYL